jgi:hypothetical protein
VDAEKDERFLQLMKFVDSEIASCRKIIATRLAEGHSTDYYDGVLGTLKNIRWKAVELTSIDI